MPGLRGTPVTALSSRLPRQPARSRGRARSRRESCTGLQTATLAHDDARSPPWATRADGARDGAHTKTLERRGGRHALMALATALMLERTDAYRFQPLPTGLTRYARYDALITPPSPTQRGVDEGMLAPRVKYRTAALAHDDAQAPSWATRADGARDGAHAREIERRRVPHSQYRAYEVRPLRRSHHASLAHPARSRRGRARAASPVQDCGARPRRRSSAVLGDTR